MTKSITSILLSASILTGCAFGFPGVYRIDVPQGNLVDERKVQELKVGMEPRQVRYLLGTPLLTDSFNPNRWDYYYSLNHDNKTEVSHHLVITFTDGRVSSIEDRLQP